MVLADLDSRYTANRQFGKALPFFLRLRRQNVFELIREHNLFTDVKDQVLLLIEFDQELLERRKQEGIEGEATSSEAIALLVDHPFYTCALMFSCLLTCLNGRTDCSRGSAAP